MNAFTQESPKNLWRSLHALNLTRIVIAVLMCFWSVKSTLSFWNGKFGYYQVCAVYILVAIAFTVSAHFRRRNFMPQLLTQTVFDLIIISFLYMLAGGMKSGIAILYLFPLCSAAILVRPTIALFFAALASIFLLGQSVFLFLRAGSESTMVQAGLYGAAFMLAVFILNRLAARLISQETLATQRGQHLKVQQAINQLVIASMDDGLVVIDGDGKVFASNPSADRKLGINFCLEDRSLFLSDFSALKPLSDAFFAWHQQHSQGDADGGTYIKIKPGEGIAPPKFSLSQDAESGIVAHLKVRFAQVQTSTLEERFVIFLQNVAGIENRAQQLKLASMGRLTASIAHEVRNPLSAIAHASALLSEEVANQSQLKLLNIVSENVTRMNRMVEDILNLSRKARAHELIRVMDIAEQVHASITEIHHLPKDMIQFEDVDDLSVRFDPLHLREVLLNLVGNAIRYASGRAGSIRIHSVSAPPSRVELHVQDDGPSITPEVRAHLFEPFYTTSSKGTGLGLYLARELCLNNGAMLDYEFHPDVSIDGAYAGRFVISFPVAT